MTPIAPTRGGRRPPGFRSREDGPDGPRKRRKTCHNYSDLISFIVGEAERELVVPRAPFADIPYFKSALNFAKVSSPKGNDRPVLKLREVDPDLFNLYSNWATSKELPYFDHVQDDATVTKRLADLWLLGQFFCDTAFQNHVADITIATHRTTVHGEVRYFAPAMETAVYVWQKTGKDSKLKTLFLDLFMSLNAEEVEQQRADFDYDGIAADTGLLFDLYLCRAKRGSRLGLQSAETYHEKEVAPDTSTTSAASATPLLFGA